MRVNVPFLRFLGACQEGMDFIATQIPQGESDIEVTPELLAAVQAQSGVWVEWFMRSRAFSPEEVAAYELEQADAKAALDAAREAAVERHGDVNIYTCDPVEHASKEIGAAAIRTDVAQAEALYFTGAAAAMSRAIGLIKPPPKGGGLVVDAAEAVTVDLRR